MFQRGVGWKGTSVGGRARRKPQGASDTEGTLENEDALRERMRSATWAETSRAQFLRGLVRIHSAVPSSNTDVMSVDGYP